MRKGESLEGSKKPYRRIAEYGNQETDPLEVTRNQSSCCMVLAGNAPEALGRPVKSRSKVVGY